MSALKRALIGALLGALIVLLAHPAARPYFAQGIWDFGRSGFLANTPYLTENLNTLPKPSTKEIAALWLLVGTEREIQRQPSDTIRGTLCEIAEAYAAVEPDNAYWRQMDSYFLAKIGRYEASEEAWKKASLASSWNDHQTPRLQAVIDGLKAESGRKMAWHYAFAYTKRSNAFAQCLARHSRNMLLRAVADNHAVLEARIVTALNGNHLRVSARSIDAGEYGRDMVALSMSPLSSDGKSIQDLNSSSPRARIFAQQKFLGEVESKYGAGSSVSQLVRSAIDENESRLALINPVHTTAKARLLTFGAVATATVPGILLLIGIIGALLNGLGRLLEAYPPLQWAFRSPIAPILGVVIGATTYFSTGLLFPAIWAAVVFGSFSIFPNEVRALPPHELGAAFRTTQAIVATCIVAALMLLFVSMTKPGHYVLASYATLESLGGNNVILVSLASVILGLGLVSAPAWAFVRNHKPYELVSMVLRVIGAYISVPCVIGAIVLLPFAIWADRSLSETFDKVIKNETAVELQNPVY